MAMRIMWYGAEHIAQYGRSRATLDATGRRHWASIHPALHRQNAWPSIFLRVVKSETKWTLYLVIEATSCVERRNATIKAEELTKLSSYQMLRMDKNHMKLPSVKLCDRLTTFLLFVR